MRIEVIVDGVKQERDVESIDYSVSPPKITPFLFEGESCHWDITGTCHIIKSRVW